MTSAPSRLSASDLSRLAAFIASDLGHDFTRATMLDLWAYRNMVGADVCSLDQAADLRNLVLKICHAYQRGKAPAFSLSGLPRVQVGVRPQTRRERFHSFRLRLETRFHEFVQTHFLPGMIPFLLVSLILLGGLGAACVVKTQDARIAAIAAGAR